MLGHIKHLFFTRWYPHWSPDTALRYWPVVSEITKDPMIHTILDVGSGGLGITPYLRRHVTGVDVTFPPPHSPFLHQKKGTADRLPCPDASYDAVLCVDVLEHIPPAQRKQVVSELFRVSKRLVVMVFPCGPHAHKEDAYFLHYRKTREGITDAFLKEHVTYGLPIFSEIRGYIPPMWSVQTKGNVSIWLHHFLLRCQYASGKGARFFSSVVLVFLIPLLSRINIAPTYRMVLTCSKVSHTTDK